MFRFCTLNFFSYHVVRNFSHKFTKLFLCVSSKFAFVSQAFKLSILLAYCAQFAYVLSFSIIRFANRKETKNGKERKTDLSSACHKD